jgi:hypothetical protein
MVDRYTQIVLTVIALALCVLVTRPLWAPTPAVRQARSSGSASRRR